VKYSFISLFHLRAESKMFSYIKTAAFAALTFLAVSANGQEEGGSDTGSFQTGVPCTPCPESDGTAIGRSLGDCTVNVKVNFFASETGKYYEC
jgi:hypothetical protein